MISLNQLAGAKFTGSSVLAQTTVEAVFTGTQTAMMIYATAAPTGGHLNPFVTMATVCAGLCTVPRGLYYLIAQTVGAIFGNYALKLGVGTENFFANGEIGGCTVDFSKSSMGQTYVMETMLYATIAFMSFGVGLDPRQTPIFGPAYSQLLVGLTLTLTVWGSPWVHAGYGGICKFTGGDNVRAEADGRSDQPCPVPRCADCAVQCVIVVDPLGRGPFCGHHQRIRLPHHAARDAVTRQETQERYQGPERLGCCHKGAASGWPVEGISIVPNVFSTLSLHQHFTHYEQ